MGAPEFECYEFKEKKDLIIHSNSVAIRKNKETGEVTYFIDTDNYVIEIKIHDKT